jgi:ATP-binding cassette subfamily A (ABC1) protein 3
MSELDGCSASLLPPTAFGLGAIQITVFEGYELGVSVSTGSRLDSNYSMNYSMIMLWVDIVLYAVLTWYLDAVLPSEFGTRASPVFCCTREYCDSMAGACCSCCKADLTPEEKAKEDAAWEADDGSQPLSPNAPLTPHHSEPRNFEKVADQARALGVGVQLRGVRKVWDDGNVAVDGVSERMYNGQLFCLLGHNGAGKSTLIGALTGLTSITAGDARINGYSVRNRLSHVRQSIGVCPQHDVLFPTLTVREHLRLFSSMKGVPAEQVDATIQSLVADIGLTEKMDAQAQTLSGGQKRKLSVAIAFVGNSKVVFLVMHSHDTHEAYASALVVCWARADLSFAVRL